MVIQLILRKKQGLVSEQDWARFLSLQHHITFFKEAPPEKGDYRRIQAGAMAAKQYCALTEPVEQIEKWFARVSPPRLRCTIPLPEAKWVLL